MPFSLYMLLKFFCAGVKILANKNQIVYNNKAKECANEFR